MIDTRLSVDLDRALTGLVPEERREGYVGCALQRLVGVSGKVVDGQATNEQFAEAVGKSF